MSLGDISPSTCSEPLFKRDFQYPSRLSKKKKPEENYGFFPARKLPKTPCEAAMELRAFKICCFPMSSRCPLGLMVWRNHERETEFIYVYIYI